MVGGVRVTPEQLAEVLRSAVLNEGTESNSVDALKGKLSELGDGAIPQLDRLLADPSLVVSEAAADILESIGSQVAYDKLVEYALRHLEDPTGQTKLPGPGWVRLRRLGPPVLQAMARQYDSSLPSSTRLAMIFIAQQIGDPAELSLIEQALAESDSRLVEAAAEALGTLDSQEAYERLIQLIRSSKARHRVGAIRGLRRLGNKQAVRPLFDAMTSADQTVVASGASSAETRTERQLISDAIDSLTGMSLNGDPDRIRAWLEANSL